VSPIHCHGKSLSHGGERATGDLERPSGRGDCILSRTPGMVALAEEFDDHSHDHHAGDMTRGVTDGLSGGAYE
jgi:hypothetical protein